MKKTIMVVLAPILLMGLHRAALASEWSTSYGAMSLPDVASGAVRAPYADDNGRVIGHFLIPKCSDCGPVLSGVWVEDDSAETCSEEKDGSSHWGKVSFKFDPAYTSFTGTWSYCDKSPVYDWSGKIGSSRLIRKRSK
jgi:hypothetical protein